MLAKFMNATNDIVSTVNSNWGWRAIGWCLVDILKNALNVKWK